METQSNFTHNLPALDSLETLDIGKSLDYLRYLQSLQPAPAEAGRIKTYIKKIKNRIQSLVIG
jgi:hypothetical protein